MAELDRRRFLVALAATVAAATGGLDAAARGDVRGSAPSPDAPFLPLSPPDPRSRVALPDGGVLNKLPGNGDLLAWTVDDGANTDVVRLYTQFARDSAAHLFRHRRLSLVDRQCRVASTAGRSRPDTAGQSHLDASRLD
ncbi:hypothetical protein MPRS_57500 [Mycobacterium paraseoulense]|nr:hypothetical protein MPRS_57500 [Mycobacterium paraseoulense]